MSTAGSGLVHSRLEVVIELLAQAVEVGRADGSTGGWPRSVAAAKADSTAAARAATIGNRHDNIAPSSNAGPRAVSNKNETKRPPGEKPDTVMPPPDTLPPERPLGKIQQNLQRRRGRSDQQEQPNRPHDDPKNVSGFHGNSRRASSEFATDQCVRFRARPGIQANVAISDCGFRAGIEWRRPHRRSSRRLSAARLDLCQFSPPLSSFFCLLPSSFCLFFHVLPIPSPRPSLSLSVGVAAAACPLSACADVLITVTLAGAALGWLMHWVRQQGQAVAAFERTAGSRIRRH